MNEEEKAIKKLEEITKNYSLNGEDLHYAKILYYLIINLQQENERLKNIEISLKFIKNRVKQGMTQENINKCAIEFVNSYLKESDVK